MVKDDLDYLRQVATRARLSVDKQDEKRLFSDVHALISLIKPLKKINTENIEPLIQTIVSHSPTREDMMQHESQVKALAALTPNFNNDLYELPLNLKKEN